MDDPVYNTLVLSNAILSLLLIISELLGVSKCKPNSIVQLFNCCCLRQSDNIEEIVPSP